MRKRTKKLAPIDMNRLLHMTGVAKYMMEHADAYGVEPDLAYLVGLLHDIGYIYGRDDHELNGADLLRRVGMNNDICDAISVHGSDIKEVIADVIQINSMLLLLYEADMMVDVCDGIAGEVVGFDRRIAGIAKRYGEDSPLHQAIIMHRGNLEKMLLPGWEDRCRQHMG